MDSRSRRPTLHLDRHDKEILRLLQLDARISHRKLSEAVNLAPSTIFERVRRLARHGIILGYETRIDAEKLGVGQIAFVHVTLEQNRKEAMTMMRTAIANAPGILDCYAMAGQFDFLLKVRAADTDSCSDIVNAALRPLVHVKEIRTHVVLSPLKESNEVPI